MKILFIRGFCTDINSSIDSVKYRYSSFDNFFMMSAYELEYFNYSEEEGLNDVYVRLCDKIENNVYNVLIAHSMGGSLLLKFLTEHKTNLDKKYIFLMPLIEKNVIGNIMINTPFLGEMYLAKPIFIPNNALFDNGNILNEDFFSIKFKQAFEMYNHIDKLDLSILNHNNCHMIYAKGELFNIISPQTLGTIKNKTILEGKHEMFAESNHSTKFFQTLKSLLEKPTI